MSLASLSRQRWRIAMALSIIMVVVYFGFVLLIAYDKPGMGSLLAPGLSLGIVLGALVIVASWIVTWVYVRWANDHLDRRIGELRSVEPRP
jgi:uncharacterized membrane protein (DUF485 family)